MRSALVALLLASTPAQVPETPETPVAAMPVTTPAPIDGAAVTAEIVAALEATVSRTDGDITSEIEAGGYRIGLILGPPRPFRTRMGSGRFGDPEPPDPSLTFVGVVLREPRTKRFLPAATLRVNFEMEGGGEYIFYETAGPYPIYGENNRIPKPGTLRGPNGIDDLRAITVTVEPPAYSRHAEMLGSFTGSAVARFEIVPKAGAKAAPWHEVKSPVAPKPIASDWQIGDDLRQGVGETRQLARSGDFLLGFIAEGPEPVWLWKGADHPPECLVVEPNHNTHLELLMVHVPSGRMVTGASVTYAFWRRPSPTSPREEKTYALRPLMAEFYHYGLTAEVPAGEWNVTAQVLPPQISSAWGEGNTGIPEQRLAANFQYTREGPSLEGPAAEAATLAQSLQDAAATYATGDHAAAHAAATEAFFGFEATALRGKIATADPGAYKSIEREWIWLRARMQDGQPPDVITRDATAIGARLVALAGAAEGREGSSMSAFIQSFFVLLREGFEAILVLGLLAAVMRKTGRTEGLRVLWLGAIAALGASAVLAVAFVLLFSAVASGQARETFEGVTMLVAVVVLFFTSFWLISRVEGRRWAMFLKHQIEGAVTGRRRFAIASLAFLVVFREGAETVLLYASLFASAPGATPAILVGMAVASVALVVLFFVSVRGSAVLPVRQFFGITGGLLYLLAFKFAGDGIAELQNAGVVSLTAASWIPESGALQSWLGIYPTMETAALQGVLLLAVVAGLGWTFLKRPGQAAPAAG